MWIVGNFEGEKLKPLAQAMAEWYVDNEHSSPEIETVIYNGNLGERALTIKGMKAFEDEVYSRMEAYSYDIKTEKAFNNSNYFWSNSGR